MTLTAIVDRYRNLPKRTRTVLLTCLYGIGAGFAAVMFQLGMNAVYLRGLVALSRQSSATFLVGSFAVIISASLIVGWLLNSFCPEAAGSGIPQLKAAFWKDFGYVPWRVVWVKLVAGIVSIGGGCSLGREGPSVQLAGALASNLAGVAGEPKQNRRFGAAAGAAAGLAAAFNTPMAAIAFVTRCKALGFNWSKTDAVRDLSFNECQLNYSDFSYLKIPGHQNIGLRSERGRFYGGGLDRRRFAKYRFRKQPFL